jgi:uncharacterized iron-regulated protein
MLSSLSSAAEETEIFRLPIGDPERSGRDVELALDAITDCRSGEQLTPAGLAHRLSAVRLLFVGESHTDIEFHRAQLRVVRELHEAGRQVLIGLEMFPYTEQEHLDRWVGGLLTEEGFVELSHWYDAWGYHWDYYRKIFLYARDNGIPMFALNTPREVVKAVREKGLDNLSPEEADRVPARIDTDSEEHFRLFKAFFASGEDQFHASMSEGQWRGMFAAQCTWDATMAHNSVQALERHGSPEAIMVVLIGSGHVAYGLGIQRQAAQWFEGRMAAVLPIPVADEEGLAVERVQASYADFIWGLPPVTDALYPSLGLSTRKMEDSERRTVIHVAKESVAEKAGFRLGDVLLALDGADLPDKESLNRRMADLRWGDDAVFEVKRGEETIRLTASFRRDRPRPCEKP